MDKQVLTVFGDLHIPKPYSSALFFVIIPTRGARWHKDIWPAITRYAKKHLALDTRKKIQGNFRSVELYCEGADEDL